MSIFLKPTYSLKFVWINQMNYKFALFCWGQKPFNVLSTIYEFWIANNILLVGILWLKYWKYRYSNVRQLMNMWSYMSSLSWKYLMYLRPFANPVFLYRYPCPLCVYYTLEFILVDVVKDSKVRYDLKKWENLAKNSERNADKPMCMIIFLINIPLTNNDMWCIITITKLYQINTIVWMAPVSWMTSENKITTNSLSNNDYRWRILFIMT